MLKNVMRQIVFAAIAALLGCLLGTADSLAGNIRDTDKYAWSETSGWNNFSPTHGGGVTVYADHLEGYAWAENIGWIRLGTHTTGGTHTYANDSRTTYGVNRDASGNLSGYAWSELAGWISFNPSHSQVTVNTSTGDFEGYAWGENIGWIHFQNASLAYKVAIFPPGITVTETDDSTSVDESGSTDTFDVVLDTPPGSDVVITVSSENTDEATVSPESLTFTASNWDTAQTVTVTGVDDIADDGDQTVTVFLSVDDESSDDTYDPLEDQTVSVTVADNDEPAGFALSKTELAVNESGTADTFTVILDAQPASDVVISVSSGDTGEATVSPESLTFTGDNWDTAQTVTVTGADDAADDGDQTATVTLSVDDASSDDAYDPLEDQTVTVTVADDDAAGFTLSKTELAVNESGTTDSFTVVLDSQPAGSVVLSVSSGDTGEATVSPESLTFSADNWDTAQEVTVTGVDDDAGDGNQTTAVTVSVDDASGDDTYDPLEDQTVSVTVADNDTPGVTVTPTALTVDEPSGTADFTITLNTQPADGADVSFPLTSGSECTLSVSSPVTIANADWGTGVTVTVTAEDDDVDNPEDQRICAVTIGETSSADSAYGALDPDDVTVTVADDENPAIALSSTSVDEGMPSGTAVGTLSVSDYSGAGDSISFALASGDGSEDNALFAIDGDRLVTGASFDYETDEKLAYNVRVSASDGSEIIASGSFSIAVNDVTLPNDLDGDDRIGAGDAISLLQILADGGTHPAGDLNGDGSCDLKDFILILKMLVGL